MTMPTLSNHQSNDFVKALLIGDSKSGKTGSLVSLVHSGYRLCILDMDNLLDVLKYFVMHECPGLADNVEFVTLRDKYKSSPTGPVIDGKPTAFIQAMKLLDKWTDDSKPMEWGPD